MIYNSLTLVCDGCRLEKMVAANNPDDARDLAALCGWTRISLSGKRFALDRCPSCSRKDWTPEVAVTALLDALSGKTAKRV